MQTTSPVVDHYQIIGASPLDQIDRIEELVRQLAYNAQQSGNHDAIPPIVEAYRVLSDPALRHQHDLALQSSVAQQPAQEAPPQESEHQQHSTVHPVNESSEMAATPSIETLPAEEVSPEAATATPPLDVEPQPSPAELDMSQAQESPGSDSVDASGNAQEDELSDPSVAVEFANQRRLLLSMFYQRRRLSMRAPSIAIGGLESKVSFSYEVIEFHLWFMSERGWIVREESGMFSITADGVERFENMLLESMA